MNANLDEVHNHSNEDPIRSHLLIILAACKSKERPTIRELSPSFHKIRARLREIIYGQCGGECREEVEILAYQLENLRNGFISVLNRDQPYPNPGRLRLLARKVKAHPTLEGLLMLLETTNDMLDTGVQDSFALQDAIEALENNDPQYNPDDFEVSRRRWDEPGYRLKRNLQFRLQERKWLLPVFRKRLSEFTDLNIDVLLSDRDIL